MPKTSLIAKLRRIAALRAVVAVAAFACLLHVTRRGCERTSEEPARPEVLGASASQPASGPNAGEDFSATAYCLKGTTVTGHRTRPGLVSADPEVIPLGSLIYVDSPLMGGVYQVLDTGDLIKGKIIDIFIPSYERCLEFGRRIVKVKVLRYGFPGGGGDQPVQRTSPPPWGM